MTRRLASTVFLTLLALLVPSCEREPRISEAERAERVAVAQNRCEVDSDCLRTGCRGTVCRAEPDERFCEHRLVLSVRGKGGDLINELTSFVGGALTPKERETLAVHPGTGELMVAFHGSIERRNAVEGLFSSLEAGGIYPFHPDSDEIARFLAERLNRPGELEVRRAEGGPLLLERRVTSGHILTTDEARSVVEETRVLVEPLEPATGTFAYELVSDAEPPLVRVWVRAGDGVSFGHIAKMGAKDRRAPNTLEGVLDAEGTAALEALTEANVDRPLLFVVGDEVLASPLVSATIRDGRFSLQLDDDSSAELLDRIERIRATPALSGRVALDPVATQKSERDITCLAAVPSLAQCGCVEGYCGWLESEALNQCIVQPAQGAP
ncbi:MAG: hypothetical protein AUK47_17255 [Deltaproteobacteria bacterium CG2_30_63_29]|nr:MAG: hypothetical protein AUK47_17255 [Deltaproteobacteria bacterium CG2_30_63_29]PJB45910.1 MAG: hypothetical protein CO108_06495 [Deltaproteobacteria bacterium CG_4_9_14_3_um_filter_63_12]